VALITDHFNRYGHINEKRLSVCDLDLQHVHTTKMRRNKTVTFTDYWGGGGTVSHHVVLFALNVNFLIRAPVLQELCIVSQVHNEDTTWNIDQIPNSLDFTSIFLYSILSA
jgi:hypothetical protein